MFRCASALRVLGSASGRRAFGSMTLRAAPRLVARPSVCLQRPAALLQPAFIRHYSDAAALTKEEVQERIFELLGTYDKVGWLLSSLLLDVVEVVFEMFTD